MTKNIETHLLKKLSKVNQTNKRNKFNLEEILFDKQLELIRDPARFKACTCSRRAGKSYALMCYILDYGLKNDYHTILFVTSTKTRAVKIIWRELNRFNEEFALGLHFDNSKHEVKFPNGTVLILGGMKDEGEVDGMRGISPSPSLIVVDEAGHTTRHLYTFITEVATPALIDYQGTLILIGTPNPTCTGAFYDAFHKKNGLRQFKPFHWTFFDNYKFEAVAKGYATHDQIFKELVESSGLPEDHPAILREYKGVWIKDLESLVYKYDPDYHNTEPPEEHEFKEYSFVMGVDTGAVDNCGFSILGYHPHKPEAIIFESYEKDFQDVSSVIEEVNAKSNWYGGFDSIVFDPAAGGKNFMGELYQRYGLKATSAEKVKKASFISMLNADLRQGTLKVIPENCASLTYAWGLMMWKSKTNGEFKIDGIIDKGVKIDHAADSCLYAWRALQHFRYTPEVAKPKYGTEEYYKEIENSHFQKVLEETNKALRKEDKNLFKRLSKRF